MKDKITKFTFIVLPFSIYFVFFLAPNLSIFLLGLNEWDIRPTFLNVSLAPLKRLFTDPRFYEAIIHNLMLVFNSVFIQLGIAFVIAYLLRKPIAKMLKTVFNTIYFLPVAISLVAIALLWKWMYQPSGLFNILLKSIGLGSFARPWLSSVTTIFPYFDTPFLALLIGINWTWFGMYVVLFSAGMREIPQKYFDAAKIDGLSELTKIRKIVLPSIKPLWFSFSILAISGSFKSFAFVWNTTMGGPGNSTSVAGTFLYRQAFRSLDMGYASTIGMVVAIIGFLMVIISLKRSGRLF